MGEGACNEAGLVGVPNNEPWAAAMLLIVFAWNLYVE